MSDLVAFDATKSILYTTDQDYISGHSGRIRVWDTDENLEIQLSEGLIDRETRYPNILDLGISDDGSQLAVIDRDRVLLVDLESFEVVETLEATEWQSLHQLAFQPDSQQLVATTDHELWIWEDENSQATVTPLEDSLHDVSFSPDGAAFVTNANGELQIWALDGLEAEVIHAEKASFREFNSSKVIYKTENDLHVWDVAERRELLSFDDLPEGRMKLFAWSEEGSLLAVITGEQVIEVWNMTTLERTKQLETKQPAFKVQFSPNSEMLLAEARGGVGQGTELYLWKLNDARYPTTLGNNAPDITTVFSPDSQSVFTTQNFDGGYSETTRTIRHQWRLANFQYINTFTGGNVGFLKAGKVIYSSTYSIGAETLETMTFRDGASLEEIGVIYNMLGGYSASGSVFSPDGKHLLTFSTSVTRCGGDYHKTELWDTQTLSFINSSQRISSQIAFSPTAPIFADAGYSGFSVWNIDTGEEIAEITGHTDDANSITFNADGTMLMTSSDDGTVRLWGVPATGSD